MMQPSITNPPVQLLEATSSRTDTGTSGCPSIAIIIRLMDRAQELRVSLPSLLSQEYPNYSVYLVDHSSRDGVQAVLDTFRHPRLNVLRCPRPEYFNRAQAANIGVRYTFSDLLFFLDSGMTFKDKSHLSEIVNKYLRSERVESDHYAQWRDRCGFPELKTVKTAEADRRVYCECRCHGLHLLVARNALQSLGGLNEALRDWGYEDTDLTTRLELSGYARIELDDLVELDHSDALRVAFHHEKSKDISWTRNRIISDGFIKTFGPTLKLQQTPGLPAWIEINGIWYLGDEAPQQDWVMETAAECYGKSRRTAHALESPDDPIISVVLPTKNAAPYLVQALDSILSQPYPNIECIVIDGGSTDATLDILAAYGDQIRWSSQRDRGAYDAINRGWLSSNGEILAWINVDDGWTPGAATAAAQFFREDPDADVIYGGCRIIDAEGRTTIEERQPPLWNLGFAVESCHHIIDQPAAFIRRRAAQKVGWLYPAWFHDWDLWRRISLSQGKIKRVPCTLGYARVRRDNTQYDPEIIVPGLVAITKRFFTLPWLTWPMWQSRRRALSNCYLKIFQTLAYGRPRAKWTMLRLLLKALVADPGNYRNVLARTPGPKYFAWPTEEDETWRERQTTPSARTAISADSHPAACPGLPRPLVSVVVPCKNDARVLPDSLHSILSQDYENVECIVMDGGSQDSTREVLTRYGDKIRWVSELDRGPYDAINRGWQMSKGEILTWLNADDMWAPGAVTTVVEYFARHPTTDVVYGSAGVIDELGRAHGELVPRPWDTTHSLLDCDHIIFQCASFMRRNILERVDWLRPCTCHDHDLWLRIAQKGGNFARIHKRLAFERMRGHTLPVLSTYAESKIELTRHFFSQPGLAKNLRVLRRRAISNAYVRAADYLRITEPSHVRIAVWAFFCALLADPSNIKNVLIRFSEPPRRWGRVLARKLGRAAAASVRLGPPAMPILAAAAAAGLAIVSTVAVVLDIKADAIGTIAGRSIEALGVIVLAAIWWQLRRRR